MMEHNANRVCGPRGRRNGKKVFLLLAVMYTMSSCTTFDTTDPQQAIEYQPGTVSRNQMGETDWYVWVPNDVDKQDVRQVFLSAEYDGSEDYEMASNSARRRCGEWAGELQGSGYVVVTPVFPRDYELGYYPQGINYYSLRSSTPDAYRRPDVTVNAIVDQLILQLRSDGYPVQSKMLLAGYSAGGMFANRYTVLHPERVRAVAIGQSGGMLTMPMSKYNGVTLHWPMGVADLSQLIGASYTKRSLLQEVSQFVFVGTDDQADYAEFYPNADDLAIWGSNSAERLRTQTELLQSIGYNVTFRQYRHSGHSFTRDMRDDVNDFLMSEG